MARTSGRKKGTPNKDLSPLRDRAKALGVDPFEVLLLFAKGDWKALGYESEKVIRYSKDVQNEEYVIDPSTRMRAASDACKYLYSMRSSVSVDVSGSIDNSRPYKDMSGEDLEKGILE